MLLFTCLPLDLAKPFAIEEVCWMHWLGESLSIVIPLPLIIQQAVFECHHGWRGWGRSIGDGLKACGAYIFLVREKNPLPFLANEQITNRVKNLNIINLQTQNYWKGL